MSEPSDSAVWLASVEQRYSARCELTFPAVPTLLNHYAEILEHHFESLGRPMTDKQRTGLLELLGAKLTEAHASGAQSNVFVRYQLDRGSGEIFYEIASAASSLEEEYEYWVSQRVGSLFGRNPDARVLELVGSKSTNLRILDVGAGTGRNSIPLAEAGHQVVAIELAPALADVLQDEAESRRMSFPVVCGSALDPDLVIPLAPFDLVIAAEVLPHLRSVDEVTRLLTRLAALSKPDASLLVSVFLSHAGYQPSQLAREAAQVAWSAFLTPDEFMTACANSGWKAVEQQPVLTYERKRALSWPPTSWYESWTQGHDAFKGDDPPIALQWLLLSRT
ncbi:MAG: class I SAM-dependent methyltransferase [Polyangiaceae bacterium]|nr:class I SAM-dependent methyltransferase [Polyangiaceae bacterium]